MLPLVLSCQSTTTSTTPPPDAGVDTFVVVTFNTGSGAGGMGPAAVDGGFGAAEAMVGDVHYGHGLAFVPVVEDTRAFFAALQPDVVFFQEIFHSPDCALVPPEGRPGFVCETWMPGDPTVTQVVVGPDYQVACHDGKPDKCVAVHRRFGRFAGCALDFCDNALVGAPVTGCGSGTRIGRGVIERVNGTRLTVVNVHGSSGLEFADMECRARQYQRLFEDHGLMDGPAANGERNMVAGDFNTDPGRFFADDPSAAKIVEHVGRNKRFEFVTEVGERATPTYAGLANIDHVISDAFTGSCWAAGITPGHPAVTSAVHFDHRPLVCTLVPR